MNLLIETTKAKVKKMSLLHKLHVLLYHGFRAIRRYIRSFIVKAKGPPRILDFQAALSGPPRGRILFGYITAAFLKKDISSLVSHVNLWESVEMARIFNRLGFAVDVIHYSDRRFRPSKRYDILFGESLSFERFTRVFNDSVLRVYYASNYYYSVRNARLQERLEWLKQRRRAKLLPRCFIAPYKSAQLADVIVCIGNEASSSSYLPYNKNVISLDSSGFDFLKWPEGKDFTSARRCFLWMANRGMVYRGLDLVLEVFKDLPGLKLYICGPVQKEPEFVEVYKKELFQAPNIKTLGWVDIHSQVFDDLTRQCGYIVYPTCGEGESGSIITCMHCGIVPITTKESGIDLKDFGMTLDNAQIETIRSAVLRASEQPAEKLEESARRAYQEAKQRYTRERFSRNFEFIMRGLVDEHLMR